MEGKNPLHSKSNWLGIVMALVPFFPPAAIFVANHPAVAGLIAGGLTLAARAVTKEPLDWKVLKP